jgi:hypothetical protein
MHQREYTFIHHVGCFLYDGGGVESSGVKFYLDKATIMHLASEYMFDFTFLF